MKCKSLRPPPPSWPIPRRPPSSPPSLSSRVWRWTWPLAVKQLSLFSCCDSTELRRPLIWPQDTLVCDPKGSWELTSSADEHWDAVSISNHSLFSCVIQWRIGCHLKTPPPSPPPSTPLLPPPSLTVCCHSMALLSIPNSTSMKLCGPQWLTWQSVPYSATTHQNPAL